MFFLSFQMKAQNNLKVKFDDGGIVKWDFPYYYEPSIADKNLSDIYEPMLRHSGKEIDIYIPLEFIEWTVKSRQDHFLKRME